jgi:dihydrofolate synthase/folylpolyglutamate synthase
MTTNLRRFPDLPSTLPRNLEFILGLSATAMTLGLANIHALLDRLGRPERRFRSIVVAGTNGKGSVTAMLSSILRCKGYRVGRFTSPHVYSVAERVWVDGELATGEEMESAASRVAALRDELTFSYFEALTAIAFLVFAERGVEYAVLETGLGGRFDATNAVEPLLSIITGISLDHRRILGDSEEEILREKLGVTRRDVPLLIGPLSEGLQAVVVEKSQRDSFPVLSIDQLGTAQLNGGGLCTTRARIQTPLADYGLLDLPFPGGHQAVNALLAVGAAEQVTGEVCNLREAFADVYLPGRFERVDVQGKTIVLDVAHNDEALTAAVEHFRKASSREDSALVLGLLRRKELFEFPGKIGGAFGRVYLVAPDSGEALVPAELLQRYLRACSKSGEIDIVLWNRCSGGDYWLRLVHHLVRTPTPYRNILVTGSHHVVDQFGRRLFSRGGFD